MQEKIFVPESVRIIKGIRMSVAATNQWLVVEFKKYVTFEGADLIIKSLIGLAAERDRERFAQSRELKVSVPMDTNIIEKAEQLRKEKGIKKVNTIWGAW